MRTDRRHLALTPTERDRFERLRAQLEEHDLPRARLELEVLRPYATEDPRYYEASEALQWLQQRLESLRDALTDAGMVDEDEALNAQYAGPGPTSRCVRPTAKSGRIDLSYQFMRLVEFLPVTYRIGRPWDKHY
jgi:hypothetical protein